MEKAEQVTGGCLCGAVRYEAWAYLKDAYYCHCRICQKSNGAPFEIAVLVVPGTLRFLSGEPKYYQSSPFGRRGFCADCGARLIWIDVDGSRPEWTNLAVGCLDEPGAVVPTSHQCVESRLPWNVVDEGLPQFRADEIPELVRAWQETAPARPDV